MNNNSSYNFMKSTHLSHHLSS